MGNRTIVQIALVFVVLGVFLRGEGWCAQQDLNLQPLAPEAHSLDKHTVNSTKTPASTKAATSSAGLVLPAMVFVGVQGLDVHSTWRARSSGRGVEGNPVMDVATGHQIAIKAAASIGIIYVAHRLHRRHPKLAKGLLWTGTAITAGAVANNYLIASGRR